MKKLLALFAVFAFAASAGTVDKEQVVYAGGSVLGLEAGVSGRLDVTSAEALTFASAGKTLLIPYAKISSFDYSREVAHHLGVLPAIAVGLLKKRERKHFVNISFTDDAGTARVAVFEVPKNMPRTLVPALRARVPGNCKSQNAGPCGAQNSRQVQADCGCAGHAAKQID
jgi:hypothetical protein